ncbi:MAG: hypothetical protein Kow00109_15570 [Acidobacteriota bacterium]
MELFLGVPRMPRRFQAEPELVRFAEKLAAETQDAHELRCAQSILLPIHFGLTTAQTALALGRSRATVVRLQAECRARFRGQQVPRHRWGGRRHQNLTVEEEKELLEPFFAAAEQGGVLAVAPIKQAYEERIGREVPDSTIYRLLARHGWRKIAPNRRHPKTDRQAQAAWKKTPGDADGGGPKRGGARPSLATDVSRRGSLRSPQRASS